MCMPNNMRVHTHTHKPCNIWAVAHQRQVLGSILICGKLAVSPLSPSPCSSPPRVGDRHANKKLNCRNHVKHALLKNVLTNYTIF